MFLSKMLRFLAILIFGLFAISNGFKLQSRIIGGDLGHPDDFPYYIQLDSDYMRCGAALLSDKWIITAAHCLKTNIDSRITAYFGVMSMHDLDISFIPLTHQHVHPMYNDTTTTHDIALLEIPEPITFNPHIQPIELTDNCEMPHNGGDAVIAIGSGRTDRDVRASDFVVRHAQFETIESKICTQESVFNEDPNTLICTFQNKNTGQSIWTGDSGGPLVSQNDNKLVGLASAFLLGKDNKEAVLQQFMHVSYYRKWIEEITGLELPKCRIH